MIKNAFLFKDMLSFFKNSKSKLPLPFKILMSALSTNFLTKPDFVAYRFADRNHISYKLCQKLWKMQMVGWTIRTKETHKQVKNDN